MILKTKDRVLAMLLESRSFLSGSSISDKLNVSRAAVNNAVQALRLEGYVIDAFTNGGYLLKSSPNTVSPGKLLGHLPPERLDVKIKVLDEDTRVLTFIPHGSLYEDICEAIL